jgi:hypothetical protein
MAYTYFDDENHFYNTVEKYINGYITLHKIKSTYPIQKIINAIQKAHNIQLKKNENCINRPPVAYKCALKVIKLTITEIEKVYPLEEYPELWI